MVATDAVLAVYPSGAVAEGLARLYETGPDAVRKYFAYPLDRSRYQYSAETTQGELLAQAMSRYTDDNGRAWRRANAPTTYKFLSEVTSHVQAIESQNTRTEEAAFERWGTFFNRAEADGDAARGNRERGKYAAVAGQGAGKVTTSLAVPGASITAKLPVPLQRTASDIGTVLAGAVKGTLGYLTFTEDIIDRLNPPPILLRMRLSLRVCSGLKNRPSSGLSRRKESELFPV